MKRNRLTLLLKLFPLFQWVSTTQLTNKLRLSLLAISLFLGPWAQAWDQNVVLAYQLELFRNPALTLEDYRFMAEGVLLAEGQEDRAAIKERLEKSTLGQLKEILKRDFAIEYYDIPLEVLKQDGVFDSNVSESHFNRQLIKKNGVNYVRWFSHPLNKAAMMAGIYKQYRGLFENIRARMTSSRSLVVWNPVNNDHFSLKSSLSEAQGPFKGKMYNSIQARYHFQMSELLQNDAFLKNRFFAEESFVTFIKSPMNEGQIIRSLEPFKTGSTFVSLASLFEPNFAEVVAKANGFESAEEFLIKKVAPQLGETMGHLYEKYGMIHNSFHSQNITLNLDAEKKFKGVMIRDPDFDVNIDKYRQIYGDAAADNYIAKSNVKSASDLRIDFSVMNGMFDNIQMGYQDKERLYIELGQAFFENFAKRVGKIRGLNMTDEVIKSRTRNFITMQNGSRKAVLMEALTFEKILDANVTVASTLEGPTRIADKALTLEKLSAALQTGDRTALNSLHHLDLKQSWPDLEADFLKNGAGSLVGQILVKNEGRELRVLLNLLQKVTPSTRFYEVVFRSYSKVLGTVPFHTVFQFRFDVELLKLYINFAPSKEITAMWDFRNPTRLLQYPDEVLNRFFAKLDSAGQARVKRELVDYRKQGPQLWDKELHASSAKIRTIFEMLEGMRASRTLKCSAVFGG